MKISLNWVKEFTAVSVGGDELVEKIGAQLGAVEKVTDLGAKYQGIIIAKVVKVSEHPNADKLHVCLIDDGGVAKNVERVENSLVQVVCGSSNIAENQTVAWVSPGAVVPNTYDYDEQVVIDTREVRGVVSNGMIASAKELAVGTDHNGILVLNDDIKPGTSFAEYFGLNDTVIDIENKMFTHRPDCFGELGLAREIAGIQQITFKSPQWYLNGSSEIGVWSSKNNGELPLQIHNELPDLVPRFMAVAMSNIAIKSSPVSLQSYLVRMGVRPVNNVVDITNYIMLLTGQPLHAYDYDKVLAMDPGAKTATLGARYPKRDEQLTLLNGKTIKPHDQAILITSATQAIGLAGVMGGGDTEVSDATKNIIIECAVFDMYSVRKTSMINGVFTDAVTRFSKGQSPWQTEAVLAKTIEMMSELADAQVASPVIDDNNAKPMPSVETNVEFINVRLGSNFTAEEVAKLLQNVEFDVQLQTPNSKLLILSPFWRTDIAIGEDIVEEVGRLYGYDKLPQDLPKKTLKPAAKDNMLELKKVIRQALSAAGANEVLTYSFVHGNIFEKAGQNAQLAYALGNALSPDLQHYRLSITPSLLDKVHPNIKAGFSEFALFEMGKVHIKDWLDDENLPKEEPRLGFVYATEQGSGPAYYQALNYAKQTLSQLGINNVGMLVVPDQAQLTTNDQMAKPFANERSAILIEEASGEMLGIVGEFKPAVAKAFKLPAYCAGFELDLNQVLKHVSNVHYRMLSKFPKVEQDITLKVAAEVSYSQAVAGLAAELDKIITGQGFIYIQPLAIYLPEDDKSHKNISFRITVNHYLRTLKANEVNDWLDQAANNLNSLFSTQRI